MVADSSAKRTKKSDNLSIIAVRWAENETRTRDPNLGKVVLYQLSYFRKIYVNILGFLPPCQGWKYLFLLGKVVLYQLNYFRKMFNLNNQYLSIASAKVYKKN